MVLFKILHNSFFRWRREVLFLIRWCIHVLHLLFQDLNIGIALWLAARGDGWVSDGNSVDSNHARTRYKSKARIVLVGSGADEQCAGYGRHRTSYRRGRY